MTSFLEQNKDFVLKLKIETSGDQIQIRRVSLARIADTSGNISYEELVDLVLVFSLPEKDIAAINTRTYSVSLTYYDEDKDLITLASTEELMDAIELFTCQRFMRITTSVKPKFSHSTPPTSAASFVDDAIASPPTHYRTSTNIEEHTLAPPIRVVLESFAGLLSIAANNLQEVLTSQSRISPTEESLHPISSTVSKEKLCEVRDFGERKKGQRLKAVKSVNGGEIDEVSNKLAPQRNASSYVNSASFDEKLSPHDTQDKVYSCSLEKAKKSGEPGVGKPFIHGRHTCDGCLTTPIIGKRYHSTNLTDYDLCQKCFNNYKGDEMKYEPVELRRDLAFQNRWRRRHQMTAKLMARRYHSGQTSYGPHAPRNCERNKGRSYRKTSSKGSQGSQDSPERANQERTPSKTDHSKSSVISRLASVSQPNKVEGKQDDTCVSKEYDNSLKEAIRRSLDDAVPKKDLTKKTNGAVEDKMTHANDISEVSHHERIKDLTNDMCDSKDDVPCSVGIVEQKFTDIERLATDESTSENTSDSAELKYMETMQAATDTDTVDSEKLLSEQIEQCAHHRCRNANSKQNDLGNSKNDSFASDAVGNGDVAEVMGKTLDIVAGVISEMLSESEGVGRLNESGNSESIQGELIMNSSENVAKIDAKVDDADWSVVNVKSVESSGMTEFDEIGKAAGVLGSALFNSDMKHSAGDNRTNLLDSDSSFSIPSSVPTDLGTVHSRVTGPSCVSRWITELEKLRELGFENDISCIEVLERIGSDSNTMETNIDRVVDELLLLNA